jgi:hypothetical protein
MEIEQFSQRSEPSTIVVHYRRWLGRQDVVMRLEYAASERMLSCCFF